jgi:hypothetical protein
VFFVGEGQYDGSACDLINHLCGFFSRKPGENNKKHQDDLAVAFLYALRGLTTTTRGYTWALWHGGRWHY